MTSEIRTNSLTSRAGLSTVTLTDSGPMFSGITTFVDNSGFTFGVGTGSSIFTPASNTLTFGTNSNERLRIDSSGRVLIGTVKSTNSSTHYDDLTINNSDQSGAQGSTGIDLIASNDAYGGIIFSDEDAYEQGFIKYWHNSDADKMRFGTNSLDRWEISKDGYWVPVTDSLYDIGTNSVRVRNGYFDTLYGDGSNLTGITGTTINGNTDHYVVTATGTANTLQGESTLTYDGNQLNVIQTTSSSDSKVVIANSNTPGSGGLRLEFQYGTGTVEGTNRFRFGYVEGYRAGGSNDGGLKFGTKPSNAAAPTERLRIRSDGKVVIGSNYTGGTLSVTGNLITDDGTNGRVTIQADGTSTNQILSTTTGFGSYCNMKYQAADHIFLYGGNERLRITSGGQVGINQTDIDADLHIATAGSSEEDGTLKIGGSENSLGLTLTYDQAGATVSKITANPTYNNNSSLLKICVDGDGNPDQLVLNGNGKIGINIADNTAADLQVRTGTNGAGYLRLGGSSGNGIGMDATYSNSGATSTTFKQNYRATNGGALMKFDSGYFTFHTGTSGDELVRFTNNGGIGFFHTSSSLYGANTANAKGFYWDKGTASCQSAQPRNTGWSSYYINKHDGNGGSENRYIDFWLNNGQQGNITISGSGLNYGSNSDYRLKKDEVVMTDGIARVKQLRPLKFKWIKDDIDDEGFFAHEAQAVVPIAVDGTKDQVVLQSEVDAGSQRENKSAGDPIYQTMDNSKLVPVLTASIKELIAKVETLEQDNIALRARVTNLEDN